MMKWFEGNIPAAIQLAKSQKTLFIVFVTGTWEIQGKLIIVVAPRQVKRRIAIGLHIASCYVGDERDYDFPCRLIRRNVCEVTRHFYCAIFHWRLTSLIL